MNNTLNNIVDRLEQLAGQHLQIQDFNCGNTADIGTKTEDGRELKYPFLHVDYSNTNYEFGTGRGIGSKIYTVTVLILDKISTNITEAAEIMSDTEAILSDVIQFVSTDSEMKNFRIQNTDINAQPVKDNTKNGTQGWACELNFNIPYDWCSSALPFVGYSVDPIVVGSNSITVDTTNGDLNLVFDQGVASDFWTVPHDLGKFPSVTVMDSAGTFVEGEVTHIDNSILTIGFSSAFSGSVFLN